MAFSATSSLTTANVGPGPRTSAPGGGREHERIPVADALGLSLGDARVFPNAGGKGTDDVIRSATLRTNVFDTDGIAVLTHTDCGMMSASDDAIVSGLRAGDLGGVDPAPALPELTIDGAGIEGGAG